MSRSSTKHSPSYAETATAMRRVARTYNRHGPLGVAVPGTHETSEGWTGPVIRLSDLNNAERRWIGGRGRDDPMYHPTSVGILHCPTCGHWRDESPAVRCGTCGLFSRPSPHD